TTDQVTFTGPQGTIPVNDVMPLDGTNTRFGIDFDPVNVTGVYTMVIGPGIYDAYGHPMDQPFTATFCVQRPSVTHSAPLHATSLFPVDHVRLTFNVPMDPNTFTADQVVSFTGPSGDIPVTSITPVAGSNNMRFDLAFDPQAAEGTYRLVFGPSVTDVFGNAMGQNGNRIPGEFPDDENTATFTIRNSIGPAGSCHTDPAAVPPGHHLRGH